MTCNLISFVLTIHHINLYNLDILIGLSVVCFVLGGLVVAVLLSNIIFYYYCHVRKKGRMSPKNEIELGIK